MCGKVCIGGVCDDEVHLRELPLVFSKWLTLLLSPTDQKKGIGTSTWIHARARFVAVVTTRGLFCFVTNAIHPSIMVCIVRGSSPRVATVIGFASIAQSTKATRTKCLRTKRGCLRETLLPQVRKFCSVT